MEVVFIYITTTDVHQAHTIGKILVEEHIAACANIINGMQSIYHWDGKMCEDSEAILIVKTRRSLADQLVKRVKELHSYSCPCIVVLPIIGGNDDYLAWVERETED